MSRMAPTSQKKRKFEEGRQGKTVRPKKKIRKQKDYHSSSDDSDGSKESFAPVNLGDSDEEVPSTRLRTDNEVADGGKQIAERGTSDEDASSEEDDDGSEDDEQDEINRRPQKPASKRHDPEAFSTSISKILSTKLSQSSRKDPVLSRSRDAMETSSSLANERLEKKAKAKLRAEKKEQMDRGRIKDVLGFESGNTGEVAEEEKRLRKIAQRGVVKLFNAVRAAQVQADRTAKEEQKKGTVGMSNREEKAKEMSKQGFLDLISGNPGAKTVEA